MIPPVVLFARRGRTTLRIPALAVHETVVTAFAVRRRWRSDWGPSDLVARTSSDAGATWSRLRTIERGWWRTVDNPTVVRDGRGRLHLLYQRGYRRLLQRTSLDDGRTFSTPTDLTHVLADLPGSAPFAPTRFAPGPGAGVRLASGRLVVAAWGSPARGRRHRPSATFTLVSDDDGTSWRVGGFAAGPTGAVRNPSEATVATLPHGGVLLSLRQKGSAHRAFTSSADGASAWTPIRFADELLDPVCHAALATLADGSLLFVGPDAAGSRTLPDGKSVRERLTLRRSRDGGSTWAEPLVLDSGPSGYPAIAVDDLGFVHVLAEAGHLPGVANWPEAIVYRALRLPDAPG